MRKKVLLLVATLLFIGVLALPSLATTYYTENGKTGTVILSQDKLYVVWNDLSVTLLPSNAKISRIKSNNAQSDNMDISILATVIKRNTSETSSQIRFIPTPTATNSTQIGPYTYWQDKQGVSGVTQQIGNIYITKESDGTSSTATQMGNSYIVRDNNSGKSKIIFDTVGASKQKNPLVKSLLNSVTIGW